MLIAALALILGTAADWYSTQSGKEARALEDSARQLDVRERAALIAENEERNAWQPVALADVLVLIGVLATAALSILAVHYRAAARLGPMALAGVAATLTALLVLYRILQEPGFDELTTVQLGAPLALVLLGVIAFAAAVALRQEESVHTADLQSRR